MHLSKLKRIERGFTILVFLMDQHSLLIISDFQKLLLSKRDHVQKDQMNEWMNEWNYFHDKVFTLKTSQWLLISESRG